MRSIAAKDLTIAPATIFLVDKLAAGVALGVGEAQDNLPAA